MKLGPRPGKGQASRLKPNSRPLFVYQGKLYESKCHQASIKDQGTSEASITLSSEALV
ncbi:hypothetical protein F383_18353 [Gossypium arboreum]|uniref:Uncharacterized protein n=1 Tax=Gossypium arboreum TaxID=29729 RepID=A0A0B0NN67_GOSAR|nr:hypothetical protein F383_18353 [Gossypium arboreum]